jgi:hypothetical protein
LFQFETIRPKSLHSIYHGLFFQQVTSSPANNIHANLIQQRFKQTIVSAKNGGLTEARLVVLEWSEFRMDRLITNKFCFPIINAPTF